MFGLWKVKKKKKKSQSLFLKVERQHREKTFLSLYQQLPKRCWKYPKSAAAASSTDCSSSGQEWTASVHSTKHAEEHMPIQRCHLKGK